MPASPKATILGGGLTGLACAKHLPGSVIYEAKPYPGGHAYSHLQEGGYFDEGAHICHARDEEWLKMLYANAGEVIRIPQSKVANYWHGHWTTYPVQNHLRDLPPEIRIEALSQLVAAQLEYKGVQPLNYAEWVQYQYGEFLAENFYREYTDKYWRTPMEDMDIDWLSGRLLPSQLERIVHGSIAPLDEKQSVFSLFHYPASGGFFAFFKPMYEALDVRLDHRVQAIDPKEKTIHFGNGNSTSYERLVSTMPLTTLIECLVGVPDSVRVAASSLRCTQLLCVNLVIKKPALIPHHWFYIYDREIDVSRVKVLSNLVPQAYDPNVTVLQTEVFRRDDEPLDETAIRNKAVADLGELLGFDPDTEVRSAESVRVSHAYPIPSLGREQTVQTILEWLESIGITSTGLYGKWKYVWSDQAYEQGKQVSSSLR